MIIRQVIVIAYWLTGVVYYVSRIKDLGNICYIPESPTANTSESQLARIDEKLLTINHIADST
jgi:hypothetical protein